MTLLAILLMACGGGKLDPVKAQQHAVEHIQTMYPGTPINGPTCMPEAVVEGKTQCSYSFSQGGLVHAGILLCDNKGCYDGQPANPIAEDLLPSAPVAGAAVAAAPGAAPASGTTIINNTTAAPSHGVSHGMSDDWLMWYLLFNSGATTHHYHGWYDSTPAQYRSAYYSSNHRPSATALRHYNANYSRSVRSSASTRYSSANYRGPSSVTRSPTSTRTSTTSTRPTSTTSRPATTSGKTSRPAPTTTRTTTPASRPAPTPKPRPSTTRSSGWGTSRRSSGFGSSSRSSRSSGRRR